MRKIRDSSHYQPHRLFDAICHLRGLPTDTELAELLEVGSPLISKVRRIFTPFGRIAASRT